MLVVFWTIFVVETKMIFIYNFVAPLIKKHHLFCLRPQDNSNNLRY